MTMNESRCLAAFAVWAAEQDYDVTFNNRMEVFAQLETEKAKEAFEAGWKARELHKEHCLSPVPETRKG
jgi:hypothetical protein